jgi:hypothetical protein
MKHYILTSAETDYEILALLEGPDEFDKKKFEEDWKVQFDPLPYVDMKKPDWDLYSQEKRKWDKKKSNMLLAKYGVREEDRAKFVCLVWEHGFKVIKHEEICI